MLDIKPYVPFCDSPAGATAPAWVQVSWHFLYLHAGLRAAAFQLSPFSFVLYDLPAGAMVTAGV